MVAASQASAQQPGQIKSTCNPWLDHLVLHLDTIFEVVWGPAAATLLLEFLEKYPVQALGC